MTLASPTMEVDVDVQRMSWDAVREGWGDGLPLIPPTEALVEEFVDASGRDAAHSLGRFAAIGTDCTVERVAINAVMAGARPESMRLVCTALEALLEPAFDLAGVNATTASSCPVVIVNGRVRDELDIPYSYSALGGAASAAPAIGRAIRLVMRNVAGQVAGKTTESVFGQPGRVAGIVFGEWEERSPWAPLAERRGVAGDAVTVFANLGTCNILDTVASSAREVLQVLGKSLAYMGNNNFHYASNYAEQLLLVNPIWAEDVIARDIPDLDEVRRSIWEWAHLPIEWFPEALHEGIHARDRVDDFGVRLMDSPDDLHIVVCGGLGNLHGCMLPGFSHSQAVTRALS